MAKRMYNTKDMKTNSERDHRFDPIHVETQQVMPKHNAFACGYGIHGKSKKAQHKADRRANKALCLI